MLGRWTKLSRANGSTDVVPASGQRQLASWRESAERSICVTGLGRSMGDVFQHLEMLGPEGVKAEIKKTGIPAHPGRRNTSMLHQ